MKKNYYILQPYVSNTKEYGFKTLTDLADFFVKFSNVSGRIILIESAGIKVKSGQFYKFNDYKIIHIYSLKELINIYGDLKDERLLQMILNIEGPNLSEILSIFSILNEVAEEKEITSEINYIFNYLSKFNDFLHMVLPCHELGPKVLEELIKIVSNTKLSSPKKLSIFYRIYENKNLTPNLIDILLEELKKLEEESKNLCDSKLQNILGQMVCNIKTTGETLDKIVDFSSNEFVLFGASKNSNVTFETLKKIIKKANWTQTIIEIINNPLVNEELLNEIIEIHFKEPIILSKVVGSYKMTYEMLEIIIKESIILIEPSKEKSSLIEGITKSPKLTKELLKELIEKCDIGDYTYISRSKILEREIIDDLYKKVNKNHDLILFEKLLNLEKSNLMNMCGYKYVFDRLYLELLNKHLKSKNLEIRLKILEEMVREGYLTEEDIDSRIISPLQKAARVRKNAVL